LGSRKKSHYGFVNETAIRVGAGIMFTIWFFTFLSVFYAGKYDMALYVVGTFWLDFLLKVINPDWSIFGNIARFLTKHKEPVRVWAIQKRFAWSIGLVFASVVFAMLIKHNFFMDISHQQVYGTITPPMILCLICLVFMWLEAIMGYCVGCKIFEFLVHHKIMKNKDHQTCPDGACSL
jgi:hypothetical protein